MVLRGATSLLGAFNFLGPNGTRFAGAISGPKSLNFQSPPLPMPLVMMLHPSKPLRTAPYKQ